MKKLALIALVAAAAACSSSDYDDAPPQRGGYGGRGGGMDRPMMMRGDAGDGIGAMLPPNDWWHDTRISAPVNLTADQIALLDKLHDRADDIEKLDRDSLVAIRDLRSAVDADGTANGDIVNAAQRVRTLRNDVFDRQVELLASERTILSKQQWDALQSAMHEERRDDRQQRRGGYPGGGRGGRGGMGGRRPGYPF